MQSYPAQMHPILPLNGPKKHLMNWMVTMSMKAWICCSVRILQKITANSPAKTEHPIEKTEAQ
jgi:hypothetical protein